MNDLDNEVVKELSRYPGIVEKAGREYKPNLIANYLLDLVKKFNEFYSKNSVLRTDKNLKQVRLGLVFSVRQVLRNGLGLLGIDAPDVM